MEMFERVGAEAHDRVRSEKEICFACMSDRRKKPKRNCVYDMSWWWEWIYIKRVCSQQSRSTRFFLLCTTISILIPKSLVFLL